MLVLTENIHTLIVRTRERERERASFVLRYNLIPCLLGNMPLRKFTKAKPPDFYCGCHDHKTIASLSRVQRVDDHMKWRLTYIRKLTKLLFSLKDNKVSCIFHVSTAMSKN